uniref:BED-type domain-containing protein n=1 Tax=Meloidogyne javanica TaxID=6303 RepID=A0A915MCC4_MELJA
MRNRNSKYDAYFHIFDGTAKCLGKDCNYFYKSISSSFPRTCLRAHLERYHKESFQKLRADEDQQQEKPIVRPVRKRVKKEKKSSSNFDSTTENVNNDRNWCSPNDELLLMTEKVEEDDDVNDDIRTEFLSLTVNSLKSIDDSYTLLVFTAHYICASMTPCSRVLAVEPVKGEQTCENVSALLSNVLNEYRVDAFKVHLILREENDDDLKKAIRSTGFDSMQCLTIKLDLCIWEALNIFSINELLEKVKKAIRKIRKSRALSDNFPPLCDDNSIPSIYLKKGAKIRWNNALLIFELINYFLPFLQMNGKT